MDTALKIPDVQTEIVKHLDMYTVIRLSEVNKSFNTCIMDLTMWSFFLERDFKVKTIKNPITRYVKELLNAFIQSFQLKRRNDLLGSFRSLGVKYDENLPFYQTIEKVKDILYDTDYDLFGQVSEQMDLYSREENIALSARGLLKEKMYFLGKEKRKGFSANEAEIGNRVGEEFKSYLDGYECFDPEFIVTNDHYREPTNIEILIGASKDIGLWIEP